MAQSQRIICESQFFPNPHAGTRNQTQNIRYRDTWLSHLTGPLKIDLFLILFCVYVRVCVWCVHMRMKVYLPVCTRGEQTLTLGVFSITLHLFWLLRFFLFYFILCACVSPWIYVCVTSAYRIPKRMLNPVEPELQVVMSCFGGCEPSPGPL